MTPYVKFWGLRFLCFAGLLVLLCFFSTAPYFMFLFFGWLAVCALLAQAVRCPRCNTPVGRVTRFKGVRFARGLFETQCNECGFDLNPPSGGK